jgi:ribosomal protein S18 acetylase RimI-like enzyme
VQRATCLCHHLGHHLLRRSTLLAASRLEHCPAGAATPNCRQIQAARKSDIPAIMRIERVEGYVRLVGRWDAEQHAAEIENPSSRYLAAHDETDIAGFAILQGIGSANQCVRLRRIAVGTPGRGLGSGLLRSVLQICFEDVAAHRVELVVFVENERAYRTYLKTGFSEEGVVRDLHRDPDGTFRSMRLMSILRREWATRL